MSLKSRFNSCLDLWLRLILAIITSSFSLNSWSEEESLHDPFEKQIRQNLKVEKFELENGLRVLLHQDFSSPMFIFQKWFDVGSVHERPGRTGLAHFFEHMMFKGTKKYPKEVYERIINANGGSNNAFTSRDYTGYFTYFPPDKLELIIDIESDRMVNLVLNAEDVDSEREVVKEERRQRFDNSIMGSLYELMLSTVYKVSSYRWPVIGYMEDLNATRMSEFEEFYKNYYVPNNAVIVIAGDFDKEEARRLINRYYGKIPSGEISRPELPQEPVQRGRRRGHLNWDVQSTTAHLAYPIPEAGHKDSYALDLLSNILGDGSSSRLHQKLVYEDERASNIGVYSSQGKLSGEFIIHLSLRPGQGLNRSVSVVEAELKKIIDRGPTERELQKAKNQTMTSLVGSLKTISGKSRLLALNEIYFQNYEVIFQDIRGYNAVAVEDIQRVARTYLTSQRQNIVSIQPK